MENITMTVAQLEKLIKVLPNDLSTTKNYNEPELKSLTRRCIYARTLGNLIIDVNDLMIPYSLEGVREGNWFDMTNSLTETAVTYIQNQIDNTVKNLDQKINEQWDVNHMLLELNASLQDFATWYNFEYEHATLGFDKLLQDAHDWIIKRLLSKKIISSAEFRKGIPVIQEDGYSQFNDFKTVNIKVH
jgi:hypothetical protein